MNRSDSQLWDTFMQSEYVQTELKKIEKTAQAPDRNKLYGPAADPKNKTTLSDSVETMGVAAGGASLVGSGDSKALYTTKSVAAPGGEEQYADTTVEGLEDIQKAMLEVAHREPTGGPFGTQDNVSEKWSGIAAAGKATKPFTKKSQATDSRDSDNAAAQSIGNAFMGAKHMMGEGEDENEHDEHDSEPSLEDILADLERGQGVDEMHADMHDEESDSLQDMMARGSLKKKETVALLKELVKIANELDSQGQHEDASEIDAVIKSEVVALASKKK